jgi:rod shape determining protein RodA
MALGLGVMATIALVDPRLWERVAYLAWGAVCALLLLVLAFGTVRNGSQRWFLRGGMTLQPSEMMKLALVLATARWFAARHRPDGWGIREILFPSLLFLGTPAVLIFVEPDLGTALMLSFVYLGMVFVVGLRWRTIVLTLLLGAIAAPVAYEYVLDDYQRDRVVTLLNPDHDPKGKGYQTIQGRWAIGSGEWMGKGWRQGTQGRLRFLPEHHTDFIFSVYAEERGFVGCVVLLSLYFTLLALGVLVAWNANDRFAALVATGVVCILFAHMAVNLGGVLGLLPVTGVTLPLISYGGSSLLTVCAGIGMLLAVSMRGRRA